ncbi:MAG: Uncharacterised protein [Cellulomonadaceae bacterium TMED98]|nr:MAG: Uncharacterised protein [Cellulomonadaceae bacterium TMED98]
MFFGEPHSSREVIDIHKPTPSFALGLNSLRSVQADVFNVRKPLSHSPLSVSSMLGAVIGSVGVELSGWVVGELEALVHSGGSGSLLA